MSITAVFRKGVFEPVDSVSLPEETLVRIELLADQVDSRIPTPGSFAARHALGVAGTMSPDFDDDQSEEFEGP